MSATPHRPRRTGRPSKFTPEVRRRLLGLIRSGIGKTRAAALCRVSIDSVNAWERAFPDFSGEIEQAQHESIAALEKVVHTAARRGSWQAALRLLAFRCPAEYAPKGVEAAVTVRLEDLVAEIRERAPAAPPASPGPSGPSTDSPADRRPHPTVTIEMLLEGYQHRSDDVPGDADGIQHPPD